MDRPINLFFAGCLGPARRVCKRLRVRPQLVPHRLPEQVFRGQHLFVGTNPGFGVWVDGRKFVYSVGSRGRGDGLRVHFSFSCGVRRVSRLTIRFGTRARNKHRFAVNLPATIRLRVQQKRTLWVHLVHRILRWVGTQHAEKRTATALSLENCSLTKILRSNFFTSTVRPRFALSTRFDDSSRRCCCSRITVATFRAQQAHARRQMASLFDCSAKRRASSTVSRCTVSAPIDGIGDRNTTQLGGRAGRIFRRKNRPQTRWMRWAPTRSSR